MVIGAAIIEEVAETFDMLPRSDQGRRVAEQPEAPARIFSPAGRSDLWKAASAADSDKDSEEPVPVEQEQ
jgi:hypothetical protein